MLIAASNVTRADDAPVPFNPAAYPPAVQQSLQRARDDCKAADGEGVTFAPNTVQTIDLNGDGKPDYIVSYQDAECKGSAGAYCGTGGCVMDVIVSLPNGKLRTVFSDQVRGIEIQPSTGAHPGGSTIRFQLHGGYCGGHGNPSCYKTQKITTKPFRFVMPR